MTLQASFALSRFISSVTAVTYKVAAGSELGANHDICR
jgi:hypothetical protein